MGSKRFAGIRFQSHANDHLPIHVHAYFGRAGAAGVKLELRNGCFVVTKVIGVTRAEIRRAFEVANQHKDELIALFQESH